MRQLHEVHLPQKTTPRTSENHGVVRHPPVKPSSAIPLHELSVRHPGLNGHSHNGLEHVESTVVFSRQTLKPSGTILTPTAQTPLTEPFYRAVGGGRVGGGGTSEEALRRARRKAGRGNHR